MPNRTDTVAYTGAADLEAVGGRRLVRLENGWLVEGHITDSGLSTASLYVKYSKDDGATWLSWAAKGNGYMDSLALASRGNVVYSIASYNKSHFQLRYWDFDREAEGEAAAYSGFTDIDTGFSSTTGKCAMYIHEDKIYAAYSGVKSPTTSSNNVFVREGTIQADNSVAWKDAEKWTAYNSANDYLQRPSIAFDGEKVVVFAEYIGSGYGSVIAMARTGMANGPTSTILVRYTTISGGSYQTRAGQGIYVPRKINGLMNGRLWYAFWGYDATDPSYANLRCAYSDDRGATWTVEKLTSGNVLSQEYPTITATNQNQIIIIWQGEANVNHDIRMIKRSGSVWGGIYDIKSSTSVVSFSPHTIFDLSLHYTIPPVIYRDSTNAKIGFYAGFDSIKVSPKQGFIGQKTSPTNILSYTLDSFDSLPSAREYLNGVLINTKNPAAGVGQVASASQSQWEALRFGKHGDRKNIIPQNSKFWRQGGIDAAMFAPAFPIASTTTRVRTPDALPVRGGVTYEISVGVGYSMLIAEYASDYTLITYQDWYIEGTHSRTMHNDTRYIVPCLRYYDNSTIYPSVAPLAAPAVYETGEFHEQELRIENGDFVFSYTFDKRVPTNADVLTATKAVKDAQEVHIPKVRKDLIEAVNKKGGSAVAGEPFEDIIDSLNAIPAVRYAKGTVTQPSSSGMCSYLDSGTVNFPFVTVPFSSIGFIPKRIIIRQKTSASTEIRSIYESGMNDFLYPEIVKLISQDMNSSTATNYNLKVNNGVMPKVDESGFQLPVLGSVDSIHEWEAFDF